MTDSAYRSEAGRMAIEELYRQTINKANFPLESKMVSTSQGETHIIESGAISSPPLILLHGTSSNSATWFADISSWSKHFRVLAVDLPGEPGLSFNKRMTLRSDEFSTWMTSLLAELDLPHISIVGMSLGGWIALDFASRFPGRVKALSLIAPSGLASQRLSFLFKALPLFFLGDWGLQRINKIVCHKVDMPDEVVEFGRLVAKHFLPVTESIPVFTGEQLTLLKMPIQYFGGSHDALLDTEKSAQRLRHHVPQAEVNLLHDTGHVILGQTDKIQDFLIGAHHAESKSTCQQSCL